MLAHPCSRITAGLVVGISSAIALLALAQDAPPDPSQRFSGEDFVSTRGTVFTVGDEVFPVAGANSYYPMYSSPTMVDALFEKASDAGFTTMRVWAFSAVGSPDGGDVPTVSGGDEGAYFQYWDDAAGAPAINDGAHGLEMLDAVIAAAGEHGLRLVLPLTNNWSDFGGMDQYLVWARAAGQKVDSHDDFYTNSMVRGWYEEWVRHLLNHTNTFTGVMYKDDPTIMAWELANEPGCTGSGEQGDGTEGMGFFPRDEECSADTITPWIADMSALIQSIDAHHLVATGDEGFFNDRSRAGEWRYDGTVGVDSLAWSKISTIDYMSFHLYPDSWGEDAAWGSRWIAEHNAAAAAMNKPALLGEFGWQGKETRNAVFQQWLDASLASGGAGSLVWMLSDSQDDGSFYPDYDGFTIRCPSVVCSTVARHGQQIADSSKR